MSRLYRGLLVAGIILLASLGWLLFPSVSGEAPQPIRVGVLHSLTGSLAESEQPLVNAVKLAVDDINAQGGLLGRPVEVRVADGQSSPQVFAREAERLIVEEKVSVLFGCWTSICRKVVKPVVEAHQHLLFYPLAYEGMEQSANILYTGAAPNQQIIPGTIWAIHQFGGRVYLLGPDHAYAHMTNQIIRDVLPVHNGKILGERYVPIEREEFTQKLDKILFEIQQDKPDVIINTLSGNLNQLLFERLELAGLAHVPMISFRVSEEGMHAWQGGRLNHHYGVWSYFQSIPGKENQRFVEAYQARFGSRELTSDPVVSAYEGVLLWAQAVRDKGAVEPWLVNGPDLLRQSVAGPSGPVAVDGSTRHLWRRVRVGRVMPDGQFAEVYASEHPLRPAPWPLYRTRKEWQRLMEKAGYETQ